MRLPLLVANAIRERKLIAPGGRVLVALSGGPDSVALLHCMVELSKKRDLKFKIVAAHLNHGIRGTDADEDETFSRDLCKKHGVELIAAHADAPAMSKHLKYYSIIMGGFMIALGVLVFTNQLAAIASFPLLNNILLG